MSAPKSWSDVEVKDLREQIARLTGELAKAKTDVDVLHDAVNRVVIKYNDSITERERLTGELEAANKRADKLQRVHSHFQHVSYRLLRWLRESHERTRAAKEEGRQSRAALLRAYESIADKPACLVSITLRPDTESILKLAREEREQPEGGNA